SLVEIFVRFGAEIIIGLLLSRFNTGEAYACFPRAKVEVSELVSNGAKWIIQWLRCGRRGFCFRC
ncbi:hypothetical protein, partial [Rhizobium johnstonii]|uniref:hypothetical protein n=1 Tax=Rhizobium johnstonii TaxID=3019933 RepID=UPI003F9DB446